MVVALPVEAGSTEGDCFAPKSGAGNDTGLDVNRSGKTPVLEQTSQLDIGEFADAPGLDEIFRFLTDLRFVVATLVALCRAKTAEAVTTNENRQSPARKSETWQ
jgi:hypothetical protein